MRPRAGSRVLFRVAAGLGLSLALQARPAAACSCRFPGPSVEEASASSAAVFFGRAVRIDWVGDESHGDPLRGLLPVTRAITFEVDRQWKGPEGATITIYTGSGGGDCGSPFEVGQTYLVFATARESSAGPMLVTSICHRGLAAGRDEPRTVYEIEELDRLLLGQGAPDPETARQHDEIRRLYQDYRVAATRLRGTALDERMRRNAPPGTPLPAPIEPAGGAEDVVSYLCDDVADHYGKLRELALYASKEDLLAGSLFVAMEVLALRHRIGGAELSGLSARDLLLRFYAAGWEPKLGAFDLELGKFGELREDVYVDGVRGTSTFGREYMVMERAFRFEARPGGWCLDSTWSAFSAEAGESLRHAAVALRKPLDELVLEGISGLLAQRGYDEPPSQLPPEPSPALWEPLARPR